MLKYLQNLSDQPRICRAFAVIIANMMTATLLPEILTDEASQFVADLHRRFNGRRLELLAARQERQRQIDAGANPDFLEETAAIRTGTWKVAPVPADLQDRRVEITGPVDRKMMINALNSGASAFMADFEDSNTPTWENVLWGQKNLLDAHRRTLSLVMLNIFKYLHAC